MRIGNTPAVCRKSYIHPRILTEFLEETFPDNYRHACKKAKRVKLPLMSLEEKATLVYLSKNKYSRL